MEKVLRIVVGLAGLMFLILGLRWVIDPAAMATKWEMPLLEGVALNSQMGDLGAFFFVGGLVILLAVVTRQRQWFLSAALLIGTAGVFRILALLVHDATLPVDKLAGEVILCCLLLIASKLLTNKS